MRKMLRKGQKLTYDVLLFENFTWNRFTGNLFFSRYLDNNPALIFKTEENLPIIVCTINIPEFFKEYPFGDNRLVAVSSSHEKEGVLEALQSAGIVDPIFSIQDPEGSEITAICELTDPVVDLLKSFGEYYV